MNLSPIAKKTAKTLLRLKRKNNVSWPYISQHGYFADGIMVKPGINICTLRRFANSKGAYIPATIELQKAFGIYRERKHPDRMISDMSSNELRYCLQHRTPMTPTFTQKEMREFIKACKRPRTS